MNNSLKNEEKKFWNDLNMVSYFGSKPADPRVEARLNLVVDIKNKKALDLGCGGGRHTELLLKLGFETHACDVNPEMIRATKTRISDLGSATIVEGTMLDIPFPDEYFDVVVTTGVLHQAKSHQEYERAIGELNRVTKLGAVVSLNIFTNKVWDDTYVPVDDEAYTVVTAEGLWMTILPREEFCRLMRDKGFVLEDGWIEDSKQENTGPRAVFRANFVKILG
ncbi:MAG: class I SAM-dependent methyltransferase [Patescibacteria group bacterium]